MTLSDNETTVIRPKKSRKSQVLTKKGLKNFFDQTVEDMVNENPDSPIIRSLYKSNSKSIEKWMEEVPRFVSSQRVLRSSDVRRTKNKNEKRPTTRLQVRYLTQEEVVERATFNSMSPSIR